MPALRAAGEAAGDHTGLCWARRSSDAKRCDFTAEKLWHGVPLCTMHGKPEGPGWVRKEIDAERRLGLYYHAASVARIAREAAAPIALCPKCRCSRGKPCTLVWEGNEANCVPAGTHDLPTCSACLTPELRFRPPPLQL